jgi:hypothetical protein
MAKQHPAPSQRGTGPGATQTYITTTGASVCVSHGPLDPTGVVCMSVSLLASSSWKSALPFTGRINTYYGGGKDATVMTALGIGTAATSVPNAASTTLFGMTGNNFWYHVLPADVAAETTALTALVTSANIDKGGNP